MCAPLQMAELNGQLLVVRLPDGTSTRPMLINELLCYLPTKMDEMPPDLLVKCLCEFYYNDVIQSLRVL